MTSDLRLKTFYRLSTVEFGPLGLLQCATGAFGPICCCCSTVLLTLGPNVTPPPGNSGDLLLPRLALPVPFCLYGFLPPPRTSLLVFVLAVPCEWVNAVILPLPQTDACGCLIGYSTYPAAIGLHIHQISVYQTLGSLWLCNLQCELLLGNCCAIR